MLNITTNNGQIITSEEQIIVVDSEIDAIELFVTERVQDLENPKVIGPAYISNFDAFQGAEQILTPTLAGAIAEGIVLGSENATASL